MWFDGFISTYIVRFKRNCVYSITYVQFIFVLLVIFESALKPISNRWKFVLNKYLVQTEMANVNMVNYQGNSPFKDRNMFIYTIKCGCFERLQFEEIIHYFVFNELNN